MIKSTKKEVKEAIRNYILDCIGDDLAGHIANYNAYTCANDNPTPADFFTNYSCDFAFYYDDQREHLAEWLQETEEEKNRFDNEKVSQTFLALINREFEKATGYARRFTYTHGIPVFKLEKSTK